MNPAMTYSMQKLDMKNFYQPMKSTLLRSTPGGSTQPDTPEKTYTAKKIKVKPDLPKCARSTKKAKPERLAKHASQPNFNATIIQPRKPAFFER